LCEREARALKAARKTGKWDKYNNLKRLLQGECGRAHDNWLNNMIQDEGNKCLWSYMKSKQRDPYGISTMKENGQLISDSQRQADILNNQFSSVPTKADNCSIPAMGTSPFPEALDIIVTEAGIKKLLRQLRIHMAPGPD